MIFREEFFYLSNFYPCRVNGDGVWWETLENAYQSAKFAHGEYRLDINQMSPGQAKRFTRTPEVRKKIRPDWEKVKFVVMKSLLESKFRDNPVLKFKLTHLEGPIIEENWWHDNVWGQCTCPKCSRIKGRNMLGKLLMEVREELQQEVTR